jgi:hypothetical protein
VTRHARLGPSSSDIWLACLGAPAEWAKRPPKQVGFAAHEGTLCHALCEGALTVGAIPWKEGMTFNVDSSMVTVTDEMLDAVKLFTTMANGLSDACLWRVIETEVSLMWLWGRKPGEQVFGTVDFGACDGYTLYVCDLKYGAGKAVKVDGNTQLLCYAVGLLGRLIEERPDLANTVEEVVLAIIQPRAGGDPIRVWTISVADLLYWAYSTFKPAVDQILSNAPLPLTPGGHCFFCAASLDCEAYRSYRARRHGADFPDDLTLDELEPV